jgi:hypothetical protein
MSASPRTDQAPMIGRTRPLGPVSSASRPGRHRRGRHEWSDHDFAVVTTDGAEERLREDLSWLPDPEWVAMAVREEHGGFKVVYDDGPVLEFGVTSLAGLAGGHANAYEVVLERGGVAEAFACRHARSRTPRGVRVASRGCSWRCC